MKECQEADSNDCLFIDDDAACLQSLPKLILVLEKSKPLKRQKWESQLWNRKCEITPCSLQEACDLPMMYNSLYQ